MRDCNCNLGYSYHMHTVVSHATPLIRYKKCGATSLFQLRGVACETNHTVQCSTGTCDLEVDPRAEHTHLACHSHSFVKGTCERYCLVVFLCTSKYMGRPGMRIRTYSASRYCFVNFRFFPTSMLSTTSRKLHLNLKLTLMWSRYASSIWCK